MTTKITIIGSGPSSGVPCVKCFIEGVQDDIGPCARCMVGVMDRKSDGHRLNPMTLLEIGDKRLLIDFGKTTRDAILNYFAPAGIKKVDGVICTHGHADAYMGMQDVLVLCRGTQTPLFTDEATMRTIDAVFPGFIAPAAGSPSEPASNASAAAAAATASSSSVVPAPFSRHVITPNSVFDACGIEILPVHVDHGMPCLGFVISLDGKLRDGGEVCIFLSDVGNVPDDVRKSFARFKARVLVIDMLREDHYGSHFGRAGAIEEAQKIGAEETFFIGASHGLDRPEEQKKMDPSMRFSHDGLTIYSRKL